MAEQIKAIFNGVLYRYGMRTTRQGISGKENYEHVSCKGDVRTHNNGMGWQEETQAAKFTAFFETEDGELSFDVTQDFKNEFEKAKLSESFANKINEMAGKDGFPVTVEKNENGKLQITQASLQDIYTQMYPGKAKKKYEK